MNILIKLLSELLKKADDVDNSLTSVLVLFLASARTGAVIRTSDLVASAKNALD